MRDRLTTLGELAGIGAVAAGCWLVAPALGLIVAGAGLFAASFAAGGRR